jgi:hypothetical protein
VRAVSVPCYGVADDDNGLTFDFEERLTAAKLGATGAVERCDGDAWHH